jgi:hypothetical protein
LCYFFGALWICAEPEIDENPQWFGDYGKNLIQFERRFNPIIHSQLQSEEEKKMNEHLYMVASDCCLGSYCNTAAPEECNAMIDFIPPLEWNYSEGYTDLEHFIGTIRKKIVCLKLTRCVSSTLLSLSHSFSSPEAFPCSEYNNSFLRSWGNLLSNTVGQLSKGRRSLLLTICQLELNWSL